MNFLKLENEALHLPKKERTALIQKLVMSLDVPSVDELRADWLSEAENRAKELDEGLVQPVPGDEVLRKARSLIK
jgi:putative addiction module component (TIGR02574 family)